MLFLGIDLGTSSVKVSVVDSFTRATIASLQYPEIEMPIISPQPGWAEQNPNIWWENTCIAIERLHNTGLYNPQDIASIGIAYQMHGLVMVDDKLNSIYNSIIWCDSRAIEIGDVAAKKIGVENCLSSMLNTPGNFTASKLAWIKKHEPDVYARIYKIMLPGDFIAMKLTGICSTTISGLSEGILWDFKNQEISEAVIDAFDFNAKLLPKYQPCFTHHGTIKSEIAAKFNLPFETNISYKAGDQPNNALALNVFSEGEVMANAGTSGVIYSISAKATSDPESKINSFAHVNYNKQNIRIGQLLCINGGGITSAWIRSLAKNPIPYSTLNESAAAIPEGADGLSCFPFGNGAERMFGNLNIGAQIKGINYTIHKNEHLYRAGLEGVAYSFKYGLDLLQELGTTVKVIRAAKANMFLSDIFIRAFVNATGIPLELYQTDGAWGAAIGAGIGSGCFTTESAFEGIKPIQTITPDQHSNYPELYIHWKSSLIQILQTQNKNSTNE